MNSQEYHHILDKSSLPKVPLISRLDYDANGVLIYFGLARKSSSMSDAAWIIEKYFYNADGTLSYTLVSDFLQIWDNRATSVTYS